MSAQSETSKRLAESPPQSAEDIKALVDKMRASPFSFEAGEHIAMADALEATLLFHSSSPWDESKSKRWVELTGVDVATTRNLCDFIRAVLG